MGTSSRLAGLARHLPGAKRRRPEVMIVGAGPVGLLSALHLAERGIRVEIIDESWRTGTRSYGLALHPASLQLLDEVGLSSEIIERGHRINRIGFYEGGERRAELRLSELAVNFPFLVVVPQWELEDTLEERLRHLDLRVRWNHRLMGLEVENGKILAGVEKLERVGSGYGTATTVWEVEKTLATHPRFLIGADGHRSMVRRTVGIDFEEVGESEMYAVFEITAEAPDDEVRIVLDGGSADVLWPLGDGRFRWNFQLTGRDEILEARKKSRLLVHESTGPYPRLPAQRLRELVAERAPWFEPAIGEVGWSAAIRFERRLASRFVDGNVVLAGDAGHLAAPIGVHSLNVGLREGHDLASRLTQILRGDASHELLEGYDRERRSEWRRLHGLEGEIFAEEAVSPWIRRRAERLLPTIPASGADLDAFLSQLGLALGEGSAEAKTASR